MTSRLNDYRLRIQQKVNNLINGPYRNIFIGIIIILAIILIMVLYRLYKSMNSDSRTLIPNNINCSDASGEGSRFNEPPINISHLNLEKSACTSYSYSFWMYVENWTQGIKRVLVRGNPSDGYLNPGIYLFPDTNKLMVRVMSSNFKTCAGNNSSLFPPLSAQAGNPGKAVNQAKTGINPEILPKDDQDGTNYLADIPNIPLQRWLHVGVTLDDRILDVYLNGKLARSGFIQGVLNACPHNDQIHIGKGVNEKGFDGWMNCLKIYDYALTASDMYKLYAKGPSKCGKSNLGDVPIDKYRLEAGVKNLNSNADHSISFNL